MGRGLNVSGRSSVIMQKKEGVETNSCRKGYASALYKSCQEQWALSMCQFSPVGQGKRHSGRGTEQRRAFILRPVAKPNAKLL